MGLFLVRIADGRELRLKSLYQSETYEGLLEGAPNKELNDLKLDVVRVEASGIAARSGGTPSFVLVPPPVPYKTGDKTEERLPLVTCIGLFESEPLSKGYDISYGVVGWFQEEPGEPDQDALAFLDWASFAKDGSF